ncbi:CoA-binding protein [Ammonicoccus fulvus]|uniref:CoA-binding protein n=1 Tax=Ammonicoccus fulvus TaxID=3138240 RepID=A0ABZ3FNV8_9ACTN
MTVTINDPEAIRTALLTPGTWAVVGLSNNHQRTAYRIADWLIDPLGHRIIPVHPSAEEVFGEKGYAGLADIPDGTKVDVVDCFVRSELVGAVVDEAIAERERLGITMVWLQLGVIDEEAAERAHAAGLDVVMDTCPKIEYPKVTESDMFGS